MTDFTAYETSMTFDFVPCYWIQTCDFKSLKIESGILRLFLTDTSVLISGML